MLDDDAPATTNNLLMFEHSIACTTLKHRDRKKPRIEKEPGNWGTQKDSLKTTTAKLLHDARTDEPNEYQWHPKNHLLKPALKERWLLPRQFCAT